MEDNKKKKTIYHLLIIVAIVIPILLAISYAYFQATILGEDPGITGKSTDKFEIDLVTENNGYINVTNVILTKPEDIAEESQKGYFKVVSGNNKHYITYDLSLSELTVSANLQVADFKWQLVKDEEIINSGTFNGVSSNSMNLVTDIEIGNNETHEYELRIWLQETEYDQMNLMNGTFSGKVALTADMRQNPIPPVFNNYIIGLADDSETTGVYNENGYRYEGLDPNNYVTFNNELWRIIGVFDSNTHGITDQNLVKIIRNDSIGNYAWDSGNVNNWNTSSLKTYLNGDYYNGLNQSSKNLIVSVTWKLGGYSDFATTANMAYTAERGITVYSGRPTSGTGNVGLMYPSDYGYAVLSSTCQRTKALYDYDSSGCYNQNWLYKGATEWTLTPNSSNSSSVWRVYYHGYVDRSGASNGYAARPSLYLKSNTIKISGDGTSTNPYIIGE